MSRTHPSQDIRPLSDFRANAAAFIRHVRQTRRPVVLTQRGRSAAVLLDVREYERILDEIELLRDVRAAEEEFAGGGGHTHEEAKAKVLAHLRR